MMFLLMISGSLINYVVLAIVLVSCVIFLKQPRKLTQTEKSVARAQAERAALKVTSGSRYTIHDNPLSF